MLEQIRRTIGEYNFAGQYQQAPSPLGGGLVKAAWLRHYTPGELPESFERIVQSWDTASKATELGPHPSLPRMRGRVRVGVHDLGDRRQGPLSDRRIAPAHGIPGAEARGARAIRALRAERRLDRGQGLGHPADPGADPRRPPRRHPLPAADRQGHAHARPDRDDRERLCPCAGHRTLARSVFARADHLPQRQARRPGQLDGTAARLVQARQRPQHQRRDLRALPPARRGASPRAGSGPCGPPPRPARRRLRSAALRRPPQRGRRRHGRDVDGVRRPPMLTPSSHRQTE